MGRERKNPHWNYRRFPTVEECEDALKETELQQTAVTAQREFWEQMHKTALMIAGRRPSDETDFTNPAAADDPPVRVA